MKKMINYHTHTYRCGHALGNEYEMVEAALHEGYQELGMSCHIALPHYRSHLLHSLTSIRSLQGLKSCIGALLRNGPKMRMPYNEKQDYLDALDYCQKHFHYIKIYKGEILVLELHQVRDVDLLLAQGTGTAVAGDKAAAAVKLVDGQAAVVGAAVAGDGFGGVLEGLQFFVGEDLALLQRQILGGQCRAEGAHQTGDGGTGDVAAQLLLKGPEHCVVVEGAALHHNVLAQLVGRGHTQHLVDGVLDDGDGETGGDVGHAGAILLGLLDGGVHEHRAAGAQVHRLFGEQAQLGEIGDVIAQRLGEGLNKGTAAGGTGLVQHDGVHRAVADLEALHVLTADVDDEVHVGIEVLGSVQVSHRLHKAQVAAEGAFDEILAITDDGAALDVDPVAAQGVDLVQLLRTMATGLP